MTKEQIDEVLDQVRSWPEDRQEEAVLMLLALEERSKGIYELDDEELAEIEAALEEADRGEFATDEEMKALFDRYRNA